MHGEDARGLKAEKCRFGHVDFHPILQAGVETNGMFNPC